MALAAPRAKSNAGLVVGSATLLLAVVAAVVLALLDAWSYEVWGPVIVVPALVAISIPALRRQAEREDDEGLFTFLLGALLLKLFAAIPRYFVAYTVYSGAADATQYDAWGRKFATAFWNGHFATGLSSLSGTDFIKFLTGLVYSAIGSSRLAGFVFFSWFGFWGLFLFYRAFVLAVPEGRRSTYVHLLFLVPSLAYWPSSIGKEAWMMFALGVGSFGIARILSGATFRGLILTGAGLWFASLVRPHIAAMLAVGLAAAFAVKKPRAELRQVAPVAKAFTLCVVVVIAGVLIVRTDSFLHSALQVRASSQGIGSVLTTVEERTQQGGSSFAPSVLESPWRTPVAAVTVLFRPLLFDATNVQSLISGVEGSFLLMLCLIRYRWVFAALGSTRRQPYVAMALAYIAVFVFAFSSVANFGLLARERVQLLPFFLVLLSIPPAELREREAQTTDILRAP